MEEPKINVTAMGDSLTIRQGQAPPVEAISPIRITADIEAPIKYFNHRDGKFDWQDAFCEVDYHARQIDLYINPEAEFRKAVITGRLKVNTLLTETFKINKDATFTKNDFVRLIKMNRRYFTDRTETFNLIAILEKLSLKIEREIRDENDKKGTYNMQIKQALESDLPDTIILKAPIFNDEEPVEVYCELYFDLINDKPHFYLISPDMEEYIQRKGEEKIINALTGFENKIPVFYV